MHFSPVFLYALHAAGHSDMLSCVCFVYLWQECNVVFIDARQEGPLLRSVKKDLYGETVTKTVHDWTPTMAGNHPGLE